MPRLRLASPTSWGRELAAPLLGGLLLAAAFPPWRLWPAIFVAWVPLWALLDGDARAERQALPGARRPERIPGLGRAFARGWLMGMSGFLLMLHWILALSSEEVTIPWLMTPAFLLIGVYLGLFFGAAAWASRLAGRAGRCSPLWCAPALTALFEWLRAQGPLGFSWGAPGYALAGVPELLQPAAVVGFWGFVALILAVNALFAGALAGRARAALAAALLLAAGWGGGAATLRAHPAEAVAAPRRPFSLLVAQPDIRREIKWKPEKRAEVFRRVFTHAYAAAERARERGFELFVWPETVLPVLLLRDPEALTAVREFAATIERPVLLGTQELYEQWGAQPWEQGAYNSALVVYPRGRLSARYRKMRLVPFSERMPLQQILPGVSGLDFGQSNFFPGQRSVLFDVAQERLGCLICFESAFPEVARAHVRAGATVLVNITNDFWFGRSAGPAQHADLAILRAVENRVPLVRCANTGVSFVVDPWGRLSHRQPIFARTQFRATVAAGSGSLASRLGRWPLLALVAAAAGLTLAGRRRARHRDG